MKNLFLLLVCTCLLTSAHAQLLINTTDVPVTIDFTGFAGAGFQPGGGPGMLNSDEWSATGFSDGNVDFGGTGITGDFAKGTTMGLVTSGGIYAVDIAGNQGLMVQPTADDFTAGSFILKIENNTGVDVTELSLAYTIYILNDAGRSNAFNFSVSYDNLTYTSIPALDYASPEAMDFTPYIENKSTSITGLTFTAGSVMYLRWTGDDISGTGSRDEFALDDIAITAVAGVPVPLATFSPAGDIANEGDGSVTTNISLTTTADCSLHVAIDPFITAGIDDVPFAEFDVTFTAGGATEYAFDIPINDDLEVESDELFLLNLEYISGGCAVGLPAQYALVIVDNDVPPPPTYTVYTIAEISGEDVNGVNPSNGTLAELTGIVHGVNTWDGGLQFTLIDATAGISVFSYDNTFGYTVTEGDEITVQGEITQFNGLTEIEPDTLWFIDGGNPLQTPAIVTALNESTESQLVKISGLVYADASQWLGDGSSFNVTFTDGTNDYIIRIDDNTMLSTIPAPMLAGGGPFTVDITGIGSQYDTATPFTEGYQLMPRYMEDIIINAVVSVSDPARSTVSVYPNPVLDVVHIAANQNIEAVEVRTITGKVIFRTFAGATQIQIPAHTWAPGTYVIVTHTANGSSSTMLIKQ